MSTPARPGQSPVREPPQSALVGKGFNSDVYAWGEGRVLKLFCHGVPRAKAEREYRATRAVHAAGLPTPAAYELVDIDGRCGIVFERVDGVSLLRHTLARPWMLFKAVRWLAELHAQIHRCKGPAELPAQREWIASDIDAADGLSAAEKEAARRRLADLPDGTALCHGDFHPENVLLTPSGPVIIDWDTATRGQPLGDVACTARLIQNAGLPPWSPRYAHLLLACTRRLMLRSYLKRYLELNAGSRQEIAAWRAPLAAARAWRVPGRQSGSLLSLAREVGGHGRRASSDGRP
jgi:aminoglycoside phosphotransferase (APT) family kinase protein